MCASWLTEAQLRAKMNAEEAQSNPDIVARIRETEATDRRIAAMNERTEVAKVLEFRPKRMTAAHAAAPAITAREPRPRITIGGAPKRRATRTHTLEERRDAATFDDPIWDGIEATMPTYVRIGIQKGDLWERGPQPVLDANEPDPLDQEVKF